MFVFVCKRGILNCSLLASRSSSPLDLPVLILIYVNALSSLGFPINPPKHLSATGQKQRRPHTDDTSRESHPLPTLATHSN